jgi:hypothetical protein
MRTERVSSAPGCRDRAERVRIEMSIYVKEGEGRVRIGVESDKWDLVMGFHTSEEAEEAEETSRAERHERGTTKTTRDVP